MLGIEALEMLVERAEYRLAKQIRLGDEGAEELRLGNVRASRDGRGGRAGIAASLELLLGRAQQQIGDLLRRTAFPSAGLLAGIHDRSLFDSARCGAGCSLASLIDSEYYLICRGRIEGFGGDKRGNHE